MCTLMMDCSGLINGEEQEGKDRDKKKQSCKMEPGQYTWLTEPCR